MPIQHGHKASISQKTHPVVYCPKGSTDKSHHVPVQSLQLKCAVLELVSGINGQLIIFSLQCTHKWKMSYSAPQTANIFSTLFSVFLYYLTGSSSFWWTVLYLSLLVYFSLSLLLQLSFHLQFFIFCFLQLLLYLSPASQVSSCSTQHQHK